VEPLPSPSLQGRIALVTGATRGIGRACALALAGAGAHVVALGRTQGALESFDDEVQALGRGGATLVPLDLRSGEAIDRLGAALYERWGRLDILIGAAGALGVVTPVAHLEPKTWDQVIAVNLTANYRLIRSLDPLLRQSDAGRAVFLSSGVAAAPRAYWGAYAASKAGLETLARTYADEVEQTPVRVAVVNPGPMRTKMRAQAFPGEDADSLPAPEAITPLILQLVDPASAPASAATIDFRAWAKGEQSPFQPPTSV
jgi:NAD(P)-dependent dehydrogenase (short-subunit alcohol dehydrogenase family)